MYQGKKLIYRSSVAQKDQVIQAKIMIFAKTKPNQSLPNLLLQDNVSVRAIMPLFEHLS